MEDQKMDDVQPVQEDSVREEGAFTAEERSAWVRCFLPDSIYIWACGETAESEGDKSTLSDMFIGWVVLVIQGLVYAALLFLGDKSTCSTTGECARYSMASVAAAMYLLVATTLPDLRAGFVLLVNGKCCTHRICGVGLLIMYGLMVSASMKVLMSSAEDSSQVLLNGVTVLFVADLDEKALAFFSTVSKQWRLFWTIFSVWISYALGLVAVVYYGDSNVLDPIQGDNGLNLEYIPSWFYIAVSPGAAILCSFVLSNALQKIFESCSDACESDDGVSIGDRVGKILVILFGAMKSAKALVEGDRCFYAVATLWLAQGVVIWTAYIWNVGGQTYAVPVALTTSSTEAESEEYSDKLIFTPHMFALVFPNVALVTGLALKAYGMFLQRRHGSTIAPKQHHDTDGNPGGESCGSCADSRLPSLLVGWGIGYWVTSVLYVFALSWHSGGWTNAHIAMTIAGYVIIPSFFILGIFTLADTNFLGEHFGAFINPAVGALKDNRRMWYWIVATVLRDVLILWVNVTIWLTGYIDNF